MRLLIFFILLSFYSEAQIISASPPYRVRGGCSYLLDTYSGAAAAYSLRKLDKDYTGSAIRVRRSSDNTEQDIGFVSCGDLDTSSLKTFVGTGGTDDGFVVTWYDQSGNGRNVTEATAGNQPGIMDNGAVYRSNGDIGVYFVSASNNILTSTFTGFSISTTSVFGVFTPKTGDAAARVMSFCTSSQADYQNYVPFLQNGGLSQQFGAYTNSSYRAIVTGFSSTALNIFTGISDGTAVKNSINDAASIDYTFTTPTHTIDRITIGASAINGGTKTDGNLEGFISEVIFYNSDKTSDKTSILGNINTYWGVY